MFFFGAFQVYKITFGLVNEQCGQANTFCIVISVTKNMHAYSTRTKIVCSAMKGPS